MKVRNVSGRALAVFPADHPPFDAEPGEEIEVPEALGKSLAAQEDNWSAVGVKKETK